MGGRQEKQTQEIFDYTKKRDTILDKGDSISHLRDSISNHTKDSLLGISLEINREQIALQRNISSLNDRPYISITKVEFFKFENGEKTAVSIRIRNSGKVVAAKLTFCNSISIFHGQFIQRKPGTLCASSESTELGPNDYLLTIVTDSVPQTKEIKEGIESGKIGVSINVFAKYSRVDGRKEKELSECRIYDAHDKNWYICKVK
jgi:hypothetical protein